MYCKIHDRPYEDTSLWKLLPFLECPECREESRSTNDVLEDDGSAEGQTVETLEDATSQDKQSD